MKRAAASLCSIFFFLFFTAYSQEVPHERYDFVKERSVNRSYPAKGNSLSIENKFGEVKIIPWEKNEIRIDVHIIASSTDEEMAVRMLNSINVLDNLADKTISFTTIQGPLEGKKECKGCKTNCAIDYEIHLPVSTALVIKNSFGHIQLPDYPGSLFIESKYGSVSAGNLSNPKSILIMNGKGQIKEIRNGLSDFKWSNIEIGKLSGKNTMLSNYCHLAIGLQGKEASSFTLTETYSNITLRPSLNFGAEYFVESNFGEFKNISKAAITNGDEKNQDATRRKYILKNGNGASKVFIKSKYGKISIIDGSGGE